MKFPRFPRRIRGPRIWDMNLCGVVFAKWHHTTNKLISFTLRKREKNKIQSKKFKPQRRKFAYRASTFSWEIDHESWFKARENIKSKHFVTVKNNFPTLFSYWFQVRMSISEMQDDPEIYMRTYLCALIVITETFIFIAPNWLVFTWHDLRKKNKLARRKLWYLQRWSSYFTEVQGSYGKIHSYRTVIFFWMEIKTSTEIK